MRHQESSIQQSCYSFFCNVMHPELKLLLFAVPNGGGRRAVEAQIMKAEGVTAGVSDMLLLVPSSGYHGLCLEFKRQWYEDDEKGRLVLKKSYQRKEQKEWQEAVEAQGYRYVVIRSLQEFKDLVEDYLKKL